MGRKKTGKYKKCCNSECENDVYYKPYMLKLKTPRYCSHSCSNKINSTGRFTGFYKICENCENEFYVQKNQSKYKCCSVKCANENKIGISLGKDEYEIKCKNCKMVFYVQNNRKNTAKYCSIKCASIYTLRKWKKNRYNPEACKIIEQYGKENGYNFQHAENGGEYQIPDTRYFVDGYDKEKSVVVEYDETHHYNKNGKLKQIDIKRQNEIMNVMKSKFIRIKYSGEVEIYV